MNPLLPEYNEIPSPIDRPAPARRAPWYKSWRFTLLGAIFYFSALLFATTSPQHLIVIPQILSSYGSSQSASLRAQVDPSLLDKLFPIAAPDPGSLYLHENQKSMHGLVTCMAAGTCTQNQTRIVILGAPHFSAWMQGHVQGEHIWARSVTEALRELGYTLFFVQCCSDSGRGAQAALTLYRQFPALVKAVFLGDDGARWCFTRPDCIYSPDRNPTGLPLHLLLSFYFWGNPDHPLGGRWTLSPYDYARILPNSNNTFLGYSIEHTCRGTTKFVPHDQRARRAYVLGKFLRFFVTDTYAWPGVDFVAIGVPMVGGIIAFGNLYDMKDLPKGIDNLGKMGPARFYAELARSRVLLGVGASGLSPSPYQALCLGVPFINPVLGWDPAHPEDRTRWNTQHDGMKMMEEPYVYHVRKGDAEGLARALRTAMDTPIDSYVPPEMTFEALKQRVGEIIERDWLSLSRARIAELGWDNEYGNGGQGRA